MATKYFLPIIILSFLFSGCSKSPVAQSGGGMILVDSLQVFITRDETPGFLYPAMEYELRTTTRLSAPGFIITYIFQGGGMSMDVSVDGSFQAYATPMMHSSHRWGKGMLDAGQRVPVVVQLDADLSGGGTTSMSTSLAVNVGVRNDGERPEAGSRQVTGPEGETAQPVFSRDGRRVFYHKYVDGSPGRSSICVRGMSGGAEMTIVDMSAWGEFYLGGFALADGDSSLVYVLYNSLQKSRLVTLNLLSMHAETVVTDGFLGYNALVPVPGTKYLVTLTGYYRSPILGQQDLVLVDRRSGHVEVLVPAVHTSGGIDYGSFPDGSSVYYNRKKTLGNVTQTVYRVDLATRMESVIMEDIPGYGIFFAPDGVGYVALEYDESDPQHTMFYAYLYRNGNRKRITTYFSTIEDLVFSPDGMSIAIATNRRSDKQIWWIPL